MIVRIVLDTNVVISGLLWRRATYRVIVAIRSAPSVRLFSSGPLITELSDVLQRPSCAKQLRLIGKNYHGIVTDYLDVVDLVEPASISRTLPDPNDNIVLATALAAGADLIVSGDSDLTPRSQDSKVLLAIKHLLNHLGSGSKLGSGATNAVMQDLAPRTPCSPATGVNSNLARQTPALLS